MPRVSFNVELFDCFIIYSSQIDILAYFNDGYPLNDDSPCFKVMVI